MSLYSDWVNANCDPADIDEPVPVCPNCGVLGENDYKHDADYYLSDGYGPFPSFRCLRCGSTDVDWE